VRSAACWQRASQLALFMGRVQIIHNGAFLVECRFHCWSR